MLDLEMDGFYCKECNDLHPTLFWHKLYDDYKRTKEEAIIFFKENAKTFGKTITDEDALGFYYKNMCLVGLEYSEEMGECVICKNKTHYKGIKTKQFICSDKCKYAAE